MQYGERRDMMTSMSTTAQPVFLELSRATTANKNTILTGKERGRAARDELGVNKLYEENELVVIVVPENVVGISSSFTNGLLSEVVLAAGGFDAFFPRLAVDAPPKIVANLIRDLKIGSLPPPEVLPS